MLLLSLEYMYKVEVYIGIEDANELNVISDRSQENELSRQCLRVIEKGLSHFNVIELLAEADGLLCLNVLQDICIQYVVSNY